MFKRPWYSTARKKQVSYLHNFRSVQITAWLIKLVWKEEIINNIVPERKDKIRKGASFHINGLNQNCLFSHIITGKTLSKNCQNLSTSLKCFTVSIITHLVQSVHVKRCSLLCLHVARTLAVSVI